MISRDGRYWSTGITVAYDNHQHQWYGAVDYYDDGFASNYPDTLDVSTEGTLRTRGGVGDGRHFTGLRRVVDTLIADAGRLGITFETPGGQRHGWPTIYYKGDSDAGDAEAPEGWRDLFNAECERLGWRPAYQAEVRRG